MATDHKSAIVQYPDIHSGEPVFRCGYLVAVESCLSMVAC